MSQIQWKHNILWIFDEQPCYEVFGQHAGVAEELLIEGVVHRRHVSQSLLLVVAQERRGSAQAAGRERLTERSETCRLVGFYLCVRTSVLTNQLCIHNQT